MQQRDPIVDILYRVLKCPVLASCLGLDAANRSFGRYQVGFGDVNSRLLDGDRGLIGFLVELGEEISLAHRVVVIHQNR